ncbi:RHS repeat-associated core domain-containing protein, partial [Colwellia hornerae]
YYRLGGKLVATKNTSVEYIHTDYLGSPAAFSNSSGVINKTLHYQPFGETIGTQSDDVGYTGHKFDTDIGLSYMQARYYDPVIGRFYSNDPIGFRDIHSFNRYAYANNNPYKYTDPTGMSSVKGSCGNRPGKCYDSGGTPEKSQGWVKTGTNANGDDRFSFVNRSIVDQVNMPNNVAGYALALMTQVAVGDSGMWLGKNLKYNSPTWGGNGYTGGRSVAYARANYLKFAGRASLVGSIGMTAYNVQSGRQSATKGFVDVGMAVVGVFWPFGTFASISYFTVDTVNDGNWTGKH